MQKFFDHLMKLPYSDLCTALDCFGIYHHPCATQERLVMLICEHIK